MKEFLKDWGFCSLQDVFQSTLHYKSIKPMFTVSVTVAGVSSFIDKWLGLEPMVFLAFCILLIIEFATGISASIKEGKKIESRKFGRFVFKVFIYTVMIAVVHILNSSAEGRIVGKVYNFIYWVIIDYISLQLIISVFENLSRLGFQETSKAFKKINKYLSKWFDLNNKK
tara:strand:- start:133 stop:642 length:510 start_codon:yes stop_codon:yes gene_type:complete